MENSTEIPSKTRNKTTIWPNNPTPRHTPWRNQNWKRHMYPTVHCSTIYVSYNIKQPRCPSTEKRIKKLWYIYTMENYSDIHGNIFESVLMRWMNLEPIIQSEVNQKEKDKYHILIHIYTQNLEKWYWRIYLQGSNGETDIENRLMDMGWCRGGEGEMYGDSNMETSITICKIDSRWNLLNVSGNSNRGSVSTWGVEWGGKWERGSKGRGYMYTYGWFMLMFDRKQQNSVKQLSFIKK